MQRNPAIALYLALLCLFMFGGRARATTADALAAEITPWGAYITTSAHSYNKNGDVNWSLMDNVNCYANSGPLSSTDYYGKFTTIGVSLAPGMHAAVGSGNIFNLTTDNLKQTGTKSGLDEVFSYINSAYGQRAIANLTGSAQFSGTIVAEYHIDENSLGGDSGSSDAFLADSSDSLWTFISFTIYPTKFPDLTNFSTGYPLGYGRGTYDRHVLVYVLKEEPNNPLTDPSQACVVVTAFSELQYYANNNGTETPNNSDTNWAIKYFDSGLYGPFLAWQVTPAAGVGGTVSGGGATGNDASTTVTATPAAGYTFANWTESGTAVSTSASYAITVTANHFPQANFVPTVSIAASPTSILNDGSKATFTASRTGYTTFPLIVPLQFAASVNVLSSGLTISGSASTVTIPAGSASVTFQAWQDNISYAGQTGYITASLATSPLYVQGASSSATVNVNMATYTLAATASPAGAGTFVGLGTYNYGSTATITAVPTPGYAFDHWDNGLGQMFTWTNTKGNQNWTAFFDLPSVTISASPTSIYNDGAKTTFTVSRNGDNSTNLYVNVQWSSNLNFVSSVAVAGNASVVTIPAGSASATFQAWQDNLDDPGQTGQITAAVSNGSLYNIGSPSAATATVIMRTYTLTATASPAGAGTFTGLGTYNYGATATISAVPAVGYIYNYWSNGLTQTFTWVNTQGDQNWTCYFGKAVIINAVIISGADTPRDAVDSQYPGGAVVHGSIIALGGGNVPPATNPGILVPEIRYANGTWIPPLVPYGFHVRIKSFKMITKP